MYHHYFIFILYLKRRLTGDYFYQIGQLSIVIFTNTILLENIFKKKSK